MGKSYLEINRPARAQFRAPRRRKPTGLIVIHTAESVMDSIGPDTGAENVARFIQRRADPGSYHRLCDSDSVIPLVRFGHEAYQDGTGSNPFAIGIAFACRTTDWKRMSNARRIAFLNQGANAVAEAARWLKNQHGVTLRIERVTKAESDRGVSGFISHGERDPGRRSDPGADFPWDEFFALVNAKVYPKAKPASVKPKGDEYQDFRRKLLAAEKATTKAAQAADKIPALRKQGVAKRLRARVKVWTKRRIASRPKNRK